MPPSDSSDLSSPPISDSEAAPPPPQKKTLKLKYGKLSFSTKRKAAPVRDRESSPDEPEREPSPPHYYALADNPDIAFIVMFRARFAETFPKNVPNLGPQDVERGVGEPEAGEHVENLLCALIGLVLNRKKYVERGHHGRALEEAISTQKSQWPQEWKGINPLHGNNSFQTMSPTERLTLLKTLILWSLNTSDVITGIIKESYKQTRRDDDVNQPLSIQPWGMDGRKRRYFLIEGQTDTPFRVYKESAPKSATYSWWSVAGTIPELQAVEQTLRTDTSQAAKRLADRMMAAVPTLEATEEKRKRKEYRKAQRKKFARPEPGFSMYEGRTRGKRMKYTFSDEEDDEDMTTDGTAARRSLRQSSTTTPAEANGPTYTSSGRQVRSRLARFGDPSHASEKASSEGAEDRHADDGRATRSGATRSGRVSKRTVLDEEDDDEEMEDDDEESGGDHWEGDDDEGAATRASDEEDSAMSDNDSQDSLLEEPKKLIVQLKYGKKQQPATNGHIPPAAPEGKTTTEQGHPFDVPTQVEANGGPPQPPQDAFISHPDSSISVLPTISASSAQAHSLLSKSDATNHSSASASLPLHRATSPSLPTKLSTSGPAVDVANGIAQNAAAGPVLEGPAPLPAPSGALLQRSASPSLPTKLSTSAAAVHAADGVARDSAVGPVVERPAPLSGSAAAAAAASISGYTLGVNGRS